MKSKEDTNVKRKCAYLAGAFLVLLLLGAWYHLPKGIRIGGSFWRAEGNGAYVSASGDRAERISGSDLMF